MQNTKKDYYNIVVIDEFIPGKSTTSKRRGLPVCPLLFLSFNDFPPSSSHPPQWNCSYTPQSQGL